MNVREVLVNTAVWVRQSSPNFARLRQSSHEGARMLPVHLGKCILVNVKRGFDTGVLVKATLPKSSMA